MSGGLGEGLLLVSRVLCDVLCCGVFLVGGCGVLMMSWCRFLP